MSYNFLVTRICLPFVFHHFLVVDDKMDDMDDKVLIVQHKQGIDVGDHDVACKQRTQLVLVCTKKLFCLKQPMQPQKRIIAILDAWMSGPCMCYLILTSNTLRDIFQGTYFTNQLKMIHYQNLVKKVNVHNGTNL